jgi:hypothetical protein
LSSLAVPFEHGIDRLSELYTARLVDTASVYLEVAEIVLQNLVCAEL